MVETQVFSLDRASYVKIYRGEHYKSMKKNLYFYLLIILFVIGISFYGFIKSGTLEVFVSWVPFLIIFSIFLVFLYWLFPVYLFNNKENRYSFTNRRYRFFEDKLQIETEEGVAATIPYGVIVKRNIGKDYFAFWETALTAYFVPFDAFESKSDVEFVKNYLRKYV